MQITQALANNPSSWPSWLTFVWNREPSGINSVFKAQNGSSELVLVAIDYQGDIHRITFGDYLLKVGTDLVYMRQGAFEATYEAV